MLSSARTEISMWALSAITLEALPALTAPTVITLISCGDTLRETMVCKAMMMLAQTTTGSTVRWGIAPWPPLPWIVTLTWSAEAMNGPARNPSLPVG
ncbi:hypothetical protein D3C85_1227730 [compost metagenome]